MNRTACSAWVLWVLKRSLAYPWKLCLGGYHVEPGARSFLDQRVCPDPSNDTMRSC